VMMYAQLIQVPVLQSCERYPAVSANKTM